MAVPPPRRRSHRPITPQRAAAIAVVASIAATGASPAASRPAVLVKAGDIVPGVGTILAVRDVAVGDDGAWLARVRTDVPDPGRDEVILRDGLPWIREGDPLAGGPGPIATDLAGELAFDADGRAWAVLADVGPGNGPVLVVETIPVLMSGEAAGGEGVPRASTWTDLTTGIAAGAGRALVLAEIADAGMLREVLATVAAPPVPWLPPQVAAHLLEGDAVPGGIVGRVAGTGSEALAACRSGWIIATVDLLGEPGSSDGVLLRRSPDDERNGGGGEWQLLAREGDPSPVAGRTWNGLLGRAVAIGGTGDGGAPSWAVQASLSGSPASNQVLVRDGTVVVQEGDPVVFDDGSFTIQGFGLGPIRILPDGRLAWLADWDGVIGLDRGIFVAGDVVLRAGSTRIDGVVFDGSPADGVLLSGLDLGPANWGASPNGAWLVARGSVRDPASGADVAAAVRVLLLPACAADADADGQVGFDDLMRVLAAYGSDGGAADVDGDGDVDFADLVLVSSTWGPCDA